MSLMTRDNVKLMTGLKLWYIDISSVNEAVATCTVKDPQIHPGVENKAMNNYFFTRKERADQFLKLVRKRRKEFVQQRYFPIVPYSARKEV